MNLNAARANFMDFTNYKQTLTQRLANQPKGIHSHEHEIAREISEYVGEPKKFALWLGIVKRVGAGQMIGLLKQMKDRGITSPRYLMGCVRNIKSPQCTPKPSSTAAISENPERAQS